MDLILERVRRTVASALVVLALAWASPTWATTYYVAPRGTGDGSAASPWGSIQTVVASSSPVQAGDTIVVKAGTYSLASAVNFQKSGAVGDPITPSNDYHLQSGSPAIDKAAGTDVPTLDFEGKARPVGAAADMGAFEYGASAGSGGAIGSGGATGNGGASDGGVIASGGATGRGGAAGRGGATGSGGANGTGGSPGTGGTLGLGGAGGTSATDTAPDAGSAGSKSSGVRLQHGREPGLGLADRRAARIGGNRSAPAGTCSPRVPQTQV